MIRSNGCFMALFVFLAVWVLSPPVFGADVDFPASVRETIPIYNGAHILGARADEVDGGGTVYQVDLSVAGVPYGEVVAFYRGAAGERGWRIMEAVDHGGGFMMIARAGKYQVDVSITSETEGVRVRITVL